MLLATLAHTPPWAWGVLAAMLAVGLARTRDHRTGLAFAIAVPVLVTALSLHGTFSVFQGTPMNWLLWAGAGLLSAAWFATGELPAGVRFDPASRSFSLPGSWEPMGVMLAIFCVRYLLAVLLARHPAWTQDPGVAAMVASVYGALGGVFLGRMARLLKATRRAGTTTGRQGSAMAWG